MSEGGDPTPDAPSPGADGPDLRAAARPEALREALTTYADELRGAADAHGDHRAASVRTATHKGREIVVNTWYEITVDGRPFEAHVGVGNAGRVHYHGLPTRDFASAIDLVASVIDHFPDGGTGVAPGEASEPDNAPEQGHGQGHGHGEGGGT